MVNYIDVSKIRDTRDFFNAQKNAIYNEEIKERRKKMYCWLILTGSVALALIALGLWGMQEHFQSITGNQILSPDSMSDTTPNSPKTSENALTPHKEQGLLAKAKAAIFGTQNANGEGVANQPFQAKNIDIQSQLQLPEYSLPLNNVNLKIESEGQRLINSNQELGFLSSGEARLQGFKGSLTWKNSQLTLDGEMQGYKNADAEVIWKTPQRYVMTLLKAKVSIESTEIPALSGTSSGPLQIGSKLTLQTDKDQVSFQDYKGSLVSDQNTLILKGHVQELTTKTTEFNMELQ